MSAKNKHPKEHLIHDECYIEIERCEKAWGMTDGYNIFIIEDFTDDVIVDEWEPDFEWAWETAKYFSKKYNLEIVDKLPY